MDRSHVVETVMGDVLAQQGEGDRVCLQGQHAGVREAMLEIVGGHADVRAGIDDQRRATAGVEYVLVTVEDVMADALELFAVAAEEPVSPAGEDRPPLGGVAHDRLSRAPRQFASFWSIHRVVSSRDRHVAAGRVAASRFAEGGAALWGSLRPRGRRAIGYQLILFTIVPITD